MSLKLKLYIAAVAVVAVLLMVISGPSDYALRWGHYAGWIAICLLSEGLWIQSYGGGGTVTMASTAGLAATMLWGRGPAMLIAVVSTAVADAFVLRKPMVRVFFN